MLGLRCKVNHLGVGESYLKTLNVASQLTTLLSDLRPSSLNVRLSMPNFDISSLGGVLAPAIDSLTQMIIWLDINGDRWEDPSLRIVSFSSRPPGHVADLMLEANA